MKRLSNLSPIDFEDLCRDIATVETGKRFSAFGPGPDGGIDGRYSKGADTIILQCKHFAGSSFSNLKSALKKEVIKVLPLKPERYMLFVSQSLTPSRSNELAEITSDLLCSPHDIWGCEDIEAALRRNPKIERAHIKLWISSTAVLQRILNSGLEAFTQATNEEIMDEARVYVRNPSFDIAIRLLEDQKILIVSGPPGVGKSTLAKMISYHYLKDDWNFCAIRSLAEGFAKIDDGTPTVFFFDDFLGKIELNRQSLLQKESVFATFVKRIRRSKNARFILTTRAHIFEEARGISDDIDDKKLQLSKYILNVETYSREIKSKIFFSHLSASKLDRTHFEALLDGDWLKKIVDHKNYNPRIIASVSSDLVESVKNVAPLDYPEHIYRALEKPDLIWDKPYRSLDMKSQNLLVTLYFGSEYGQEIDEVKANFSRVHRIVCSHYSHFLKPGDFEEALKSLESGFIAISGKTVRFVNPSVRDFLKSFLIDEEFLQLLPAAARRADWAMRLWRHARGDFKSNLVNIENFARAFLPYSERIEATPSLKKSILNGYTNYSQDDLCLTNRAELLLDWWEATGELHFLKKALSVLESSALPIISWRDGQDLPNLHWCVSNMVDDDVSQKAALLVAIEARLTSVIENGLASDDFVNVLKNVQEYMSDSTSTNTASALESAIEYEFTETREAISDLDTEDALTEHMEYLESLASLTGRNPEEAISIVSERLVEVENTDYGKRQTSIAQQRPNDNEEFDDDALRSLFSNLL